MSIGQSLANEARSMVSAKDINDDIHAWQPGLDLHFWCYYLRLTDVNVVKMGVEVGVNEERKCRD